MTNSALDNPGEQATCDFRWVEHTPDGTEVTVVCGAPLQDIGEINGICPNWSKHIGVTTAASPDLEPPQTPPERYGTPNIRELLWKFGIWDDLTHDQHVELEALITKTVLEELEGLYILVEAMATLQGPKITSTDILRELRERIKTLRGKL